MKFVGVDFGINPFAITSDGKKFHIDRIPDVFYAHEFGGSAVEAFSEYSNTNQNEHIDLKSRGVRPTHLTN